MKRAGTSIGLLTLTALVCTAAAGAQEWGARRGGGMQWGTAPQPQRNELGWLLAGDETDVRAEPTDHGVRIVLTTDNAEMLQRLRWRVRGSVRSLSQVGSQAGPRAGQPAPPGRSRLTALILNGELELEPEDVDDGVAVVMRASDPAIVKRLQAEVPRLVERAQDRRGAPGAMRGGTREMQAGMLLLGARNTDVDIRTVDAGVVVRITADDPELAERIKAAVPELIEQLQERGRAMREWLEDRRRDAAGRGDRRPAPLY